MTAGNQPSQPQINSQISAMALSLRNDMQNVLNFNTWLSAVGGASFLQGLGFSSGDAATVVSTFGNLAILAQIYQGLATQSAAFNYEANCEILFGGQ
jgi:hypothetical protein